MGLFFLLSCQHISDLSTKIPFPTYNVDFVRLLHAYPLSIQDCQVSGLVVLFSCSKCFRLFCFKKSIFFNLYSFFFFFFSPQHGMLFYFGTKSTSEMQLFPWERGRSLAPVTSNHKWCFIRTCPGFRHLVWFLLPKCPYLALATAILSISSGCCSAKAQILCHIHQHSTDILDAPGL